MIRPCSTKLSSSLRVLISSLLLFAGISASSSELPVATGVSTSVTYQGSRFNAIKQIVFAEPYQELPQYRVERKHFGKKGNNKGNYVLEAGKRTLSIRHDLLDFPNKQKLFQANGICFAGRWRIDKQSSFSGQFSYLTNTPVIARASVALSGTKQKNKRAFGFALKLFPAANKNDIVPTLNVFVMHSLSGTVTQHVLDLTMDNEPPLNGLPPFSQLGVAYRLLKDFSRADKEISQQKPDVGFRPVSHLAEINSRGKRITDEKIISPRWLRLRPSDEAPRVDKDDFRDELRLDHYPKEQLIWTIEVGTVEDVNNNKKPQKSKAHWQMIGRLVLNESVTSATCDQRLHFSHPTLQQ